MSEPAPWADALFKRYPVPVVQDGFPCYAPDALAADDGYDPAFHRALVEVEATNWWFVSRNLLIVQALTRAFPGVRSLLEIGCGTGFVLTAIRKALPGLNAMGTDMFLSGLALASQRLPDVPLVQMDAREIPFRQEFDVIGAFDVIEHIEDDRGVLEQIHHALRPGGGLLLTVPQHQWLWSLADEQAHHVRRYSRRGLHDRLRAARFEIVCSTSFVSFLVGPMAAARLWADPVKREADPLIDFRISPRTNDLLGWIATRERALIASGLTFPLGGSRLVVARKMSR